MNQQTLLKTTINWHWPVYLWCLIIAALPMGAAAQSIDSARTFAAAKQYDKAFAIYDKLYLKTPQAIYPEYLNYLLEAKKLKDAEKLVKGKMTLSNPYSLTEIDLGRVYKMQGKAQKAREQFDTVLRVINGDDALTQRMAKAFTDAGEYDYTVNTFEIASRKINNIYFYKPSIAHVYHTAGQLDKALDAMIATIPSNMVTVDQVKTLFLEWIGNDADKLQMTRKMLLTRMNEDPNNANYAELLTWIYIQRNDWEGALMQLEAVDERNKEDGHRLLFFARQAAAVHEYDIAFRAYDDVMAKGKTMALYTTAAGEKISARFSRMKEAPKLDTAEVQRLLAAYTELVDSFPQFNVQNTASEFAALAAQYADDLDRGIRILNNALAQPDIKRDVMGNLKLQLGDYYVIKGKVWDASLTYSQVDKAFRQDNLGEMARFRNAKLAYYRGDFKWAQSMLTVLKASTTELIANDALYLSVLITENMPDSNRYPLERFAFAELLMFRNKDQQATQLLDSIAKAFPKHALNDDIIMTNAEIALKHNEYEKAISLLGQIVEKYGEDVLGDDALFKIAEIYRINLNDKDKAKKYYEDLLINFPGSTFVQTARKRLNEINNPVTP